MNSVISIALQKNIIHLAQTRKKISIGSFA